MQRVVELIREAANKEANEDIAYGMRRAAKLVADADPEQEKGRWGSAQEAMQALRISYATLLRWKKAGQVKTKQPAGRGGRTLFWLPA